MHNAFSVKQFLADKSITVLEDPSYSLDLKSYDFYLFLKVKNVLTETHFQSVEEANAKTTDLLKMVTPNEPQHSFEMRKLVCSYVLIEGAYVEGY
ncbi:hypothetical protein TNCV_1790101 [Trichonephila clavipes]|nr:hypothetical protein TNCV_1790101 [Trichonephila clavipes]